MLKPSKEKKTTKNNNNSFAQSNSENKQDKIFRNISIFLYWIEIILAALAIIIVLLGVKKILFSLGGLENSSMGQFYKLFEDSLGYVLLLVVGVELAIMLVRRTPESLIEVMFFVIARKMLLTTQNVYDLLLGVIALAGLFFIRKYLEHEAPLRHSIYGYNKGVLNKSK